jgi:hypothetical protein
VWSAALARGERSRSSALPDTTTSARRSVRSTRRRHSRASASASPSRRCLWPSGDPLAFRPEFRPFGCEKRAIPYVSLVDERSQRESKAVRVVEPAVTHADSRGESKREPVASGHAAARIGPSSGPSDADLERGILDALARGLDDTAKVLTSQLKARQQARLPAKVVPIVTAKTRGQGAARQPLA